MHQVGMSIKIPWQKKGKISISYMMFVSLRERTITNIINRSFGRSLYKVTYNSKITKRDTVIIYKRDLKQNSLGTKG